MEEAPAFQEQGGSEGSVRKAASAPQIVAEAGLHLCASVYVGVCESVHLWAFLCRARRRFVID